jgi:glycosyltransferase involved in cell wall biosynthesis
MNDSLVSLPAAAVPGPRVSVCIPVYNGGAFLPQAVASVLHQSFTDFELLISDDASTDGSWEWLAAQSDPRMVCRRNDRNLGPEANWNRSLEGARGAYIKLFHQDDLLDPECLARQVAALDADPGAALTFCRRQIIDAGGRLIMTRGGGWPEGPIAGAQVFRRCLRAGTNPIGEPCAVLFRAEAARAAGPFDGREPYLIDLDYWLRLLEHGSARFQDRPLASFRLSKGQWSSAIGRKQAEQFDAFVRRMAATRFPAAPWTLRLWSRCMAKGNSTLRGWLAWWHRVRPRSEPEDRGVDHEGR